MEKGISIILLLSVAVASDNYTWKMAASKLSQECCLVKVDGDGGYLTGR